MSELVTLTIDGQAISVPPGTLVVDAAKKLGIDIPVFCYHPKMEPVGMCRMCLVEIGRPVRDRATGELALEEDGSPKIGYGPKMETACTVPVMEGMLVNGFNEKVQRARKDVLEFTLTSHPLDCPVCDKGGECPLQNLTLAYGPGESRYIYDEKKKADKRVPLGDLIFLDRERCIQCARCTRFQDEVVGEPVIGFNNRGRALEIVTFSDPGFDSYFSGNTSDICPVGALTTADFRFGARPWELNAAASICPHCPVGCNTTLNVRREAASDGRVVVKRVMPRQNEQVNEVWLCDKGRFAYHFTESVDRITEPLIRKNGEIVAASWDEALDLVAEKFEAAKGGLLTLASGRLTNEDLFNLSHLTKQLGGTSVLNSQMGGGDLTAQVGVGQGTDFAKMGAGTAILVVASDLQEEAPIWWLRVKQAAERGAALIVANPRPTKTDRYAAHFLRYPYGAEAAMILAMLNAISAKELKLPGGVKELSSKELKSAAQAFAQAEDAVVIFGSEGVGLDGSTALAEACANLLTATGHTGKPNNGLIGVWEQANTQGAWDMGFRPMGGLSEAMSVAKALYVAGTDPAGDDPALSEAVQTAGFVVVQDIFMTETAKLADVILPAQAFTEREGTYTSGERRVQRFYTAIPARPGTKPDFAITAELGARLDIELEKVAPSRALLRIAEKIDAYAGLTYRKLAQTVEQWPIIGRDDLYYGGTSYQNKQGLGVQTPSAAENGAAPSLSIPDFPEAVSADGGLLAVPITVLYDQSRTVAASEVLANRLTGPQVTLNPADAEGLGVAQDAQALVKLNDASFTVTAKLDPGVPEGVALIPRSVGIPITRPTPVKIQVQG